MRAFVITGPHQGEVRDVESPRAQSGQVVVDVERVGVCGTDVELFEGTMAYYALGLAEFPLRPGHEWSGVVSAVGSAAEEGWLGRRVTGDTMLGCGACPRCESGRHHLCEARYEIGVRRGWPGALAEQLLVPASALHRLPEGLDAASGAVIEPAGCAWRAVAAAQVGPETAVCVWGTGALGLFALQIARARGARVDVVALDPAGARLAVSLGAERACRPDEADDRAYDVAIDATNAASAAAGCLGVVRPGGHVVLVGLAAEPSLVDTRQAVLNDITVAGILGASAGMAATIELLAAGTVRAEPVVAATVSLERTADVLAGWRPDDAGPGPKVHVDPRL